MRDRCRAVLFLSLRCIYRPITDVDGSPGLQLEKAYRSPDDQVQTFILSNFHTMLIYTETQKKRRNFDNSIRYGKQGFFFFISFL